MNARAAHTIRASRWFLLLLAAVVLLMWLGPSLAPYPPDQFHAEQALQAPSAAHWFGTDEFGRDLFSRVLSGARPTLLVAIISASIAAALGAITGLVTGYFGGLVDEVVMRAMDVLMSFPGMILAMLLVVVLGPNPVNVVTAMVVVFWPRSARLFRAATLQIARQDFVAAARSRGEHASYIILAEIVPNIREVLLLDLGLRITSGILLSASLAYLGVGFSPPSPAWGLLVRDGQRFLQLAPWLVLIPCAVIALIAIGAVVITESLPPRRSARLRVER